MSGKCVFYILSIFQLCKSYQLVCLGTRFSKLLSWNLEESRISYEYLRRPARSSASKPMLTVIPRSVRDVRTSVPPSLPLSVQPRPLCIAAHRASFTCSRSAGSRAEGRTAWTALLPPPPSTAPVDSARKALLLVHPFVRSFSCPGNNNGRQLSSLPVHVK